jgi:hypothetical protein
MRADNIVDLNANSPNHYRLFNAISTDESCIVPTIVVVLCKRFDLLSPTTHPLSLDLRIRIIIILDMILRTVRQLVQSTVTIWNGPALKFCSHRGAHTVIACALFWTVK